MRGRFYLRCIIELEIDVLLSRQWTGQEHSKIGRELARAKYDIAAAHGECPYCPRTARVAGNPFRIGRGIVTRILVFQHHVLEHPGTFRDFFAEDGVRWDVVRLDAGETIPPLDGYAALIVMGGPQDVWQVERYPWLAMEKAAIREAVLAREMPYLGICLGHQLLAAALGGEVALMSGKAEIGVREVEFTEAGTRDPVLGGAARMLRCLQWHAAEVVALPEGAVNLARNAASAFQAIRYGRHAYGLQFHVEATETTVPDWAAIPAYKAALERGLGEGELPAFEAEMKQSAADLKQSARHIYERFKALMAAPVS